MKHMATLKSMGIGILKVMLFVGVTLLLQRVLMFSLKIVPDSFWRQFDGRGLNEPLFISISILSLVSAVLGCYLFLGCVDKKPWTFIRFTLDSYMRLFSFGIAIAAILIVGFTLVNISVGNIHLSIAFSSFENVLILFPVSVIIIFAFVCFEELVFRGYVLRILESHFNKITAVVGSSMLFSVSHFLRPNASLLGFINIFLAGILLAIVCIYFNSIWISAGFHFGWNFLLWFLNFPLSGVVYPNPVVKLDYNNYNLVVGSKFGPEDSALSSLLLSIAIGYCLFAYTFKGIRSGRNFS